MEAGSSQYRERLYREAKWELLELNEDDPRVVAVRAYDAALAVARDTVTPINMAATETSGEKIIYSSATATVRLQPVDREEADEEYLEPLLEQVREAFIDSGAGASILSLELARALGLVIRPANLRSPNTFLKTASGEFMRITGTARVEFQFEDEQSRSWDCYVVPKFAHGLLLGTDFLEAAEVDISFRHRALICHDTGTRVELKYRRRWRRP